MADITSGLQVYLKFEEGSGTTAADATINGNDGTLNGSPTWTTGQVGSGGLDFNYLNGEDYVQIANSASLENINEGDYTIAAWFNPGSTPPGSGSDPNASYGIVIKTGYHNGLYYNNASEFNMAHLLTDNSTKTAVSGTYVPGTWHHVCGVVDKTAGTVKIYIDGSLEDEQTFTGGTAAREYGTQTWKVGTANPGGGAWGWAADGTVDEVRIYNRALTDADVAELAAYTGSGGGSSPEPIEYVRTAGALGANFSMDIGTAGTNRLVTIHIDQEIASLLSVTAVTVDGKSCTKLHDIVNTIGAGNAQQFWYIDEDGLGASAGSVTIAVTGIAAAARTQAMLHTGVLPGPPHDSGYDNTSGAVGSIQVTGIDCPANGVVIAGWGQGEMAPGTITSITTPHSQRFIEVPNSATLAGSSGIEVSEVTNKTYVLNWGTADGFRHTGIVASWEAAAATGGGRTHQMML